MQKCILIYDDDLEILTVCKVILDHENYRVETIATCENIIHDINTVKPDIILMDLWIPKIGGENAIKLMHEHEETKDIPVILFSANDEIEKVSKRINANGFLRKPFDILQLKETIENQISR
ncbi:MAG TPA: response regulator [Hanamia sp.]|jgi:DNA-binding NtrC family response regulator|nr:response regulator [Hanamia sp.]